MAHEPSASSERNFLHGQTRPFPITEKVTAAELGQRYAGTAFQARNVGHAVQVWDAMLRAETTIFFGLAGAMVPAGMRLVLTYLVQNRLVDCIVSTGAQLFHDLCESLGYGFWQTSPEADDLRLAREGYYRYYDVVSSEEEFERGEGFVREVARTLDPSRSYSTREFFQALGQALAGRAKEEGMISAAAKAGVPIYCPALGDSAIGEALADLRAHDGHSVTFDIIADVLETAYICVQSPSTAVVLVGGGTPKNFIQQAAVGGYFFDTPTSGHAYGIQITTDQPQWGGLSGSTFHEAQSWKKYSPEARFVTVNVDATVALPLIVSALAEGSADAIKARKLPTYKLEGIAGLDRKPLNSP